MDPSHKYHPTAKRLATSTQLRFFKHHTFPGLNQCIQEYNDVSEVEDVFSLIGPFPCSFRCPLPVLTRNGIERRVVNGYNAVLELPKNNYQWRQKKKGLIKKLRSSMKKFDSISLAIDKLRNEPDFVSTKQPCALAALGHHLSKKPDKYFKGNYNWYFGNCISFAYVNGKQFLLYASGNDLNQVGVARFKVKKIKEVNRCVPINISVCSILTAEKEKPIYGVVSSRTSGITGIRRRDSCSFVFLNENEDNSELHITQCLSVTNEGYPFVSMDIQDEKCCTVSIHGDIKLWTPGHSKKYTSKSTIPPPSTTEKSDGFIQIKYSTGDPNVIGLVNRSSASCYDTRIGLDRASSVWPVCMQSEICDEVSLILPSSDSNCWYIVLTHSVFLLDVRKGYVKKWTHMLPYNPSTGCVQKLSSGWKEEELVFLSTHAGSEVVCLYNDQTVGTSRLDSGPLSIPNRMDTFLSSKSNGICLDPLIDCRFEQSVIGMTSYKKKESMGLLTSTVLGDVFHQKIRSTIHDDYNSDDAVRNADGVRDVVHYLNDDEMAYLSKWESDNCFEPSILDRNTIHCTDIVDMKEIYDQIDVSYDVDFTADATTVVNGSSWTISKKLVESYNDLLAASIIDDFGMREISEWGSSHSINDDEDKDLSVPHGSIQSVNKVMNWLDNQPVDTEVRQNDSAQLIRQNTDSEEDETDGMSVSVDN